MRREVRAICIISGYSIRGFLEYFGGEGVLSEEGSLRDY
jgi:hypothetical protein